jgi:hypothetical protein
MKYFDLIYDYLLSCIQDHTAITIIIFVGVWLLFWKFSDSRGAPK